METKKRESETETDHEGATKEEKGHSASLPLRLFLHGTPRQLNRSFVAKEHASFLEQITNYHDGVLASQSLISVRNYYEGHKGSIQIHFQVLKDLVVEE